MSRRPSRRQFIEGVLYGGPVPPRAVPRPHPSGVDYTPVALQLGVHIPSPSWRFFVGKPWKGKGLYTFIFDTSNGWIRADKLFGSDYVSGLVAYSDALEEIERRHLSRQAKKSSSHGRHRR